MCGIAGAISLEKGRPVPEGLVQRMSARLRHRGPDAQGFVDLGDAAFGFTRLSIVDSLGGDQPFLSEDGSLLSLCNGEIFNHATLRHDLNARGHTFATSSDCEVIVHLFEDEKERCVRRLNGQFAFAVYDLRNRTLFAARDQFGICPLFYTTSDGLFLFASEIKALLEHRKVARQIDPVALDQVFSFPGPVSPRTLFKGIQSLENGHYLQLKSDGSHRAYEYWDLEFPESTVGTDEQECIAELDARLKTAVQLRLQGDYPVGLYLSGGLDSALIASELTGAHQAAPPSFSVVFPDAKLSERTFQRQVAAAAGLLHHETEFFDDAIPSRLRTVIYHCECPIKETHNAAAMQLSETVHQAGTKAVLTGQGADEIFGGYAGYKFDSFRASRRSLQAASPIERQIRRHLWGDEGFLYERSFEHFLGNRRRLYSSALNHELGAWGCLAHPPVNPRKLENLDLFQKRSYIDYKLRLCNHLLADHADRMTMANSVEARHPFLDPDFVAYAARLPSDLKLRGYEEKYILKKLGAGRVPPAIAAREKFGFAAPGGQVLVRQEIPEINDLLAPEAIRRTGFFNPDAVSSLHQQYRNPNFCLTPPFDEDLLMPVLTLQLLASLFDLEAIN